MTKRTGNHTRGNLIKKTGTEKQNKLSTLITKQNDRDPRNVSEKFEMPNNNEPKKNRRREKKRKSNTTNKHGRRRNTSGNMTKQ